MKPAEPYEVPDIPSSVHSLDTTDKELARFLRAATALVITIINKVNSLDYDQKSKR